MIPASGSLGMDIDLKGERKQQVRGTVPWASFYVRRQPRARGEARRGKSAQMAATSHGPPDLGRGLVYCIGGPSPATGAKGPILHP